MKIEVLRRDHKKVLCSSKYGQFIACWSEADVNENAIYDVELDTDEELVYGVNLYKTEEDMCICNNGDKVKIVGEVESIDDDGYMIVRVGTNALTFVTISNEIAPGFVVKILIDHIKAYPIEY